MADQAPPTSSESNAAGSNEAGALPEKMRVHALAKLLGITSKQVIAEAGTQGVELRSAHSSVSREVAERVRDALTTTTTDAAPTEAPAPAAEPDTSGESAAAAESSAPQLDFSAVEAPFAPTESSAAAPVEVPLFLQPDLDAAPPRRTRARRASGAPAASGSDTDSETTPGTVEAADAGSAPDTAAEQDTAPDSRGEDGGPDDGDQPRRRRRGRRGRGRGRGEQSDRDDSAHDDGEHDDGASAEDSHDDEDRAGERGAQSSETDGDQSSDAGSGRGKGRERGGRRKRTADDKKSGTDTSGTDTSADAEPGDKKGVGKKDSDQKDEAEKADDDSTSGTESADSGDESGDGSSRRRRRRRRRRSGGDGTEASSEDDPPNTVVHEREPRNKNRGKDEVQGISGSTRLEAKRQRRRDGRDAGRRRPPILTESEFLARREAVDRVMVVRDRLASGHPHASTQVAVLEDGIVVEHFVTSSSSASMVGNVYLGRVQNVLPSMEAAFIDIGRGRNGVLYAGEVNWEAAGLGGNSRKIEQALKPGDQVLVQVSKDPVGHKGARLTTQISLAGRFLVYVPDGNSTGISRKLPDTERKRLKDILREVVPSDAGVIIRTAAEGVSEDELARDVQRLQAQWETIREQSAKAESGKSGNPKTLYEEPDLLVKVVRDLFNEDFSKLVVEGDKAWETIESYIGAVAPDLRPRLEKYDASGQLDVFGAHRIDEQLAKALDRKVWLPSGGTLVIDRTEAMTVVDVNTGKFTGAGGNLEETVTRNNLEAAEEIVRQMRLRDIGGMIVVDFIDMVLESNRDLVLRRLTEALGRDRTRHQVSEVTSLGLVQMTRKKLGTGLVEAFSTTCEHCHGRGIIVHADPIEPKQESRGDARSGSRQESRRGKRGKDTRDKGGDPREAATDGDTADSAVKRAAHPVALAMAGHHQDDDAAQPSDGRAPDSPAPGSGETEAATAAESAGEVAAAEATPAVVVASSAPGESVPADRVIVSAEPAASRPVAVSEAASEPKAEPVADTDAAAETGPAGRPPRRRSRRVSRAAAAPSTQDATGTVIVVPVATAQGASAQGASAQGDADERDGAAPEPAPEPVVVSRPRRRRAAGRPAGPPVESDD
ncbi:Rne/Rng family ribonuclease [Rhodococcus triatomae]|uniref:Ribonuclease E n=1 Tax=Rhodococcus triatomae TaxID=300028 RepID=A0A1G8DR19_9NOCA|nr:translation initiation factor IF-2 N-terminal domain-containing protein [Rhodococcus triatomae]QNG18369.1 Rne/Rng family ribonuclease [Rhodococcus triatomae]QNG21961.1 Rne/Rng family ribonuclease [Rhodococcus triatomae]SDH59991.1 ribonuclease E [Rhodococcus triatomae]